MWNRGHDRTRWNGEGTALSPSLGNPARSRDESTSGRPVIFGEILFDRFPDGARVLGGAPFNVAWHLQGFRADPLLLSAVGRDDAGREILGRMREWGLDTAGVQIAKGAEVSFVDEDPRFKIPAAQAWDHVEARPARAMLIDTAVGLVYHGTLATRQATSRRTLRQVIDAVSAPTVVDLNLRDPWWRTDRVIGGLPRTGWLKLNQEELALLARDSIRSEEQCREVALRFASEHAVRHLIVTRGREGALWILAGDEVLRTDAAEVSGFVDAVGAGDAFSAVVCLGVLRGWLPERTLARASRFAAEVCRIRGATVADASLYDRQLRSWGARSEATEKD